MELEDRKQKVGGCFKWAFLVIAVVVVGVIALSAFRVGGEPEIEIEPGAKGIGQATPVTVRVASGGRGISGIRVDVVQGEEATTVFEESYEAPGALAFTGGTREKEVQFEAGARTVENLKTGDATLRVYVERPGTWLRTPDPGQAEVDLPVRLSPPSLSIRSSQHYVNQGGSEVVVYRVGETAVESGVQAGDWWFPGFELPGGDPQERFALFSVPYDMADASGVKLVVRDDVGNEASRGFIDRFFPKPYREGTIELNEQFMRRTSEEIMSHTPGLEDRGSPLENYVQINSELRQENRDRIAEMAKESKEEFLWSETFQPLAGGQVMSAFATRREYMYEGEQVDEEFHLGYDLATVERDAITASNDGVVVYADYLGIYGNVVVIDHGYGLLSLYGHLSSIGVSQGDRVERGQEIGRSGMTGLAGGDHLHFGIFLQGLAVNPVEWWDSKWIRDRLKRKLGEALPFERASGAGGGANAAGSE